MNARTIPLLATAFGAVVIVLWWAGLALIACGLVVLAVAAAFAIRHGLARRAADRPAASDLDAARARLASGDGHGALRIASRAVSRSTTPATRHAALTIVAWAALAQGYPRRAKAALEQIPHRRPVDLHLRAAVHAANGDPQAAIGALDVAGMLGTLSREGAMLLIDLHAQQGRLDRASAVAAESRDVLGAERCRMVLHAAWDAGQYAAAAKLASRLFRMTGEIEDASAFLRALAQVRDSVVVSRTLDELVGRLRRIDKIAHTRSLFTKLRADGNLPSAARSALDRMLYLIESAH